MAGKTKKPKQQKEDAQTEEKVQTKHTTDEKLKVIEDKLSELNDLIIVNKLDLINLKNTIDKFSLEHMPSESSEEFSNFLQNFHDLSKRVQNIEKSRSSRPPSPPMPPEKEGQSVPDASRGRLERLEKDLEALGERIAGLKPVKIPEGVKDIDAHRDMLHEQKKELEKLRNSKEEIESLKEEIAVLRAGIKESRQKPIVPPPSVHEKEIDRHAKNIDILQAELESTKKRIMNLEKELTKPADMPSPPTPKELETIRRKADQSLESVKNIMDYVRANESHLYEVEKKLAGFTKSGGIREIQDIRNSIKSLKEKVDKIEEGPMIPPISSLPKGLGKLLNKLHKMESMMENLEERLNSERKENITNQAQLAKAFERISQNSQRLEFLETADIKAIEQGLYKQMNEIKEMVNDVAERTKDQEERINREFSDVKKGAEDMRVIKEVVDKMNIGKISREIDSLKEKANWIEENMENRDLDSLREKIEDIERKLDNIKSSSPYVLE